jgi:hypothetical protein
LSIDPDAESNVVNEWLTSIAAVASAARQSDPRISAADLGPAFPLMAPPPPRNAPGAPRLPAVSAPPLLPNGQPYLASDIVDTLPAPRKKRAPSSKTIKTPTPFARTMVDAEAVPVRSAIASVAPTAATMPPVLVKIRPRLSWIAAAAVVGALAAVTLVRFAKSSAQPRPIEASAPVVTAPTTAVAVPPAPAVVRFSEDEGVVIDVAPSAAPSSPSPSPSVSAVRPRTKKPAKAKLEPDPEPKVVAPAPPPPPVVASPAPAPAVRKLTPSQELAEAQLRAATR